MNNEKHLPNEETTAASKAGLAEFVAARGGVVSPEEFLQLLDEGGDDAPVAGDELPTETR